MKEILVLGARIETSDDIADAVLTLAAALAQRGLTELVEFPCVLEGAPTTATLLLGEPCLLATVRVPGSAPGRLDGSVNVLEMLRRRNDELAAT